MASTPPIQNFTELDFNALKESLKDYLRTRPELVDFNFDGSLISIILDVLAYNSQNDGFYANMLGSEFFLDTAQKRDSVVSRANELGYVSRSASSAKAVLDLTLESTSPIATTLTIPTGTIFTSEVEGTTFKFNTLDDYTSTSYYDSLGVRYFTYTNVEIYEGTRLTSTTVIDQTTLTGIVLPNSKVDTSLLEVSVAPSNNINLLVPYVLAQDIMAFDGDGDEFFNPNPLEPTSNAYFIEEINDQLFKVYFGDGVLGKELELGNLVVIKYLVCSESGSNGASTFALSSSITGSAGLTTYETTASAFGGDEIEEIDSVRFNAPLIYASQNRAVTPNDYVAIIKRGGGDIPSGLKSVIAWGGEDNVPEALGYVFISVVKESDIDDPLSDGEKEDLENELLNKYSVAAIIPIVVDAEFIYIIPTVTVKYNSKILASGPSALQTAVTNTINIYSEVDLEQFGQYFRYSKLSREIDKTDIAINNNNMTIQIQRRFSPVLNTAGPYDIRFNNDVVEGSLSTNDFGYTDDGTPHTSGVTMKTVGAGVFLYYNNVLFSEEMLNNEPGKVGIIDYPTGEINLYAGFVPTNWNGTTNDIRLTMTPTGQDIYPARNIILTIDASLGSVNVVSDTVN